MVVWLAAAVSYGPWLAFYAVAVATFTFLFTDIEGSTALLGRVGQDIYSQVLADHHSIIRSGLAAKPTERSVAGRRTRRRQIGGRQRNRGLLRFARNDG